MNLRMVPKLPIKPNAKLRQNLEKDFLDNKDKYIIAMCATPSVLIEWDLIKSRKFTCYPGFGDKLKKNYVDKMFTKIFKTLNTNI